MVSEVNCPILHSWLHLGFASLFNFNHFRECVRVSHCGFNLHKPDGLCSMAVHTSSFVQFLSDCLPVIMVYCNILPNLLPIKNLLPQLLKMLPAGSCQLSLPSGTASVAESRHQRILSFLQWPTSKNYTKSQPWLLLSCIAAQPSPLPNAASLQFLSQA